MAIETGVGGGGGGGIRISMLSEFLSHRHCSISFPLTCGDNGILICLM